MTHNAPAVEQLSQKSILTAFVGTGGRHTAEGVQKHNLYGQAIGRELSQIAKERRNADLRL